MHIEEFYDQDPRRRTSAEVEWGNDWHDASDVRFEVSWVERTGELYVMREPVGREWQDPFGGMIFSGTRGVDEKEVDGMSVLVIATVPEKATLDSALDGWEAEMAGSDSISWLVGRLRAAGILTSDDSSSSTAG